MEDGGQLKLLEMDEVDTSWRARCGLVGGVGVGVGVPPGR